MVAVGWWMGGLDGLGAPSRKKSIWLVGGSLLESGKREAGSGEEDPAGPFYLRSWLGT